ncbi:MAG: hypothetical protein FWC41_04940 [Firmicutes bacterium]|nr:hypothetical protein [Bacillota bacterium]
MNELEKLQNCIQEFLKENPTITIKDDYCNSRPFMCDNLGYCIVTNVKMGLHIQEHPLFIRDDSNISETTKKIQEYQDRIKEGNPAPKEEVVAFLKKMNENWQKRIDEINENPSKFKWDDDEKLLGTIDNIKVFIDPNMSWDDTRIIYRMEDKVNTIN